VEEDGRASAGGEGAAPALEPVAWNQVVEPTPPVTGESLAATIAALADPATRSPIPDTCPFLRTVDPAGAARPPIEAPFHTNRCVALGEPAPQSSRQQQLVCLTAAHSNCPRYLRGSQAAADALAAGAGNRGPSTSVVVSALLLVAATAMSVGFLLVRGGFDVPAAAAPGRSQVAVVSAPPSLDPTHLPSTAPPPLASPEPTAVPPSNPASPSAAATPPATPVPTPSPTPAATPAPTSDRYLLLVPCPNVERCWIYTVRSGDNLRSIANYFGVPYDTVLRMNPGISDPATIRAGDEIRMPPPTR
jgi:LysM repeat protein